MSKLAILEGKPIRTKPFPTQLTVGEEERRAASRVIKDTHLSCFRGNWSQNFWGGPEIRAFEKEWANYHNCLYAISVNSCTSALQVACGAIGLAPGDEVIVTPWSMTCSATAPLIWDAVPVFADIEKDYYCLDPKSIEEQITNRTRAIIIVDLFGQPYDVRAIRDIAIKHNLMIIEDAAQAVGSKYHGRLAGTMGDIGVFSFTQGKHLTCGEGGMIVTNDPLLMRRCQLIRNHAESVISDMDVGAFKVNRVVMEKGNMVGFNMRMTELSAAIMREQLKKLDRYVYTRQDNALYFYETLKGIPAIEISKIRLGCTHSFYVQAFKWHSEKADGLHRDQFIKAVKAELAPEKGRETEGVPIGCGYIQPLYRMPLFQNGILYGGTEYPFSGIEEIKTEKSKYINAAHKKWSRSYKNCPQENSIVEKFWQHELFLWRFSSFPLTEKDRQDIVDAFYKVWENREELLK